MPKFKLTLNKYLQPAPEQPYQLLPSLQQTSWGRQQPKATSALKPHCSSLFPRGPGERWHSKTILPSALIQHTRARTSHTEIPLITANFFMLSNHYYFCGRALWPELPAYRLSSTDPHWVTAYCRGSFREHETSVLQRALLNWCSHKQRKL